MALVSLPQFDGYDSFSGAWEDWCSNTFPSDPTNLQKCLNQPMGFLTAAPWTDVGAAQRGIPTTAQLANQAAVAAAANLVTAPAGPTSPYVTAPNSAFTNITGGISNSVLIGGAVVLALGLGAVMLSKRKRR